MQVEFSMHFTERGNAEVEGLHKEFMGNNL